MEGAVLAEHKRLFLEKVAAEIGKMTGGVDERSQFLSFRATGGCCIRVPLCDPGGAAVPR
jgi:hypothetical protein